MPGPQQILQGLTSIANTATPVAIAWHVVLLAVVAALLGGWRPDRRLAGSLLALPVASVSVLAWLHGNPFNGVVIGAAALALLLLAQRLPATPVAAGPKWAWGVGLVLLAFGWVYPHFLESGAPWAYLYAAPFGLVPCPTFSAVTGLALMAGGLEDRAWSGVLAGGGLFYGLFGAFLLGVQIDAILILGAASLWVMAVSIRREQPPTEEA